ncbi:MAG: protein translocase subunit SecF [Acidimicrobiales bacterium]
MTLTRPSTRHDGPRVGPVRRLYRGQTNFDFINRWKYWFALSGTIIAIGLAALGVRGLNFSIDFKGGTVWQVPTTASVATVRGDLANVSPLLGGATITQLTNRQTGKVNIEVQAPAKFTAQSKLVNDVTTELAKIAHVPPANVTLNAIGPSWGSSITNKAIEAVIVFLVLISIAIAIYFETKMAIGALVALIHDMLVTVGIYALSGFQVSPDTVIAFLTVLGYSLYDTIVVFDKVKENTRGLASTNRVTYTDVVNLSMNQVMARSVNTTFVTITPVFCILLIGSWILGAAALNDFGLALFIGLVSGAYSSIFIASPILALLKEREARYVEIRRRLAAYPQSRQVLTAATVADGSLFGPRSTSSTAAISPAAPAGAQPVAALGPKAGARGAGVPAPRAGSARRGSVRGSPGRSVVTVRDISTAVATDEGTLRDGGTSGEGGGEPSGPGPGSYEGPMRRRTGAAGAAARNGGVGNGGTGDGGTGNGGTGDGGDEAGRASRAGGGPVGPEAGVGTGPAKAPAGRAVPPRPRKKRRRR